MISILIVDDEKKICEYIRKKSEVPIIMLTARIEDEYRIDGFKHHKKIISYGEELESINSKFIISFTFIMIVTIIAIRFFVNTNFKNSFERYVDDSNKVEINHLIKFDLNSIYLNGNWDIELIENLGVDSIIKGIAIEIYDENNNKVWSVFEDEKVLSINKLSNELNEQENLRKQLTGDIAHELRTPLTSIKGHLDTIIAGIWEPTNKRLNSINEEVTIITNLVDDLRKLAKFDTGKNNLNKELVNLGDYIKNISYNYEGKAIEKNTVIKDSGIGIAESELKNIFERFYRVDKSRGTNEN